MNWPPFQRIALVAFIAVELVIFAGAVVRVSGSGLGCPDWPTCYGCLVPPTSAEAIDFNKLDLEKFRRQALRHGRDASSITAESLRASFDAVATWTEYLNRLLSVPVGFAMLFLLAASIGEWRAGRRRIFAASLLAFVLVGFNAWLGAKVVESGLKPGVVTVHMALAIALQVTLVYTIWRAQESPWRLGVPDAKRRRLRFLAGLLIVLVLAEGVLGSQVRELTDRLAFTHAGVARSIWAEELRSAAVFLVHRSAAWFIMAAAVAFGLALWRARGRFHALEVAAFALIAAQIALGVGLARVGILPAVQVLHLGLSSLLVGALALWLLATGRGAHGN